MAARIVAVGEVLVEFMAEGTGGHRAGERYAGPFASGAPAIFADQAARMGARAMILGAVGRDAFGDVAAARLMASGVDLRGLARDAARPTGIAFVAYDAHGGRDFVYTIAASAAPWVPAWDDAWGRVDILHVSGASLGDPVMRPRILAAVDALTARGARLSFDPNLRKELTGDPATMTAMRSLLGRAAYVMPSEADAAALWPGEPFDAFTPRLIAEGAAAVALKRGAAGASLLVAGGAPIHVAGHAVREVDPTGAGDCFGATLVTLLEAGAPPAEALAHANAAGALAVGRLGPMEGNSGPEAIRALTSPS